MATEGWELSLTDMDLGCFFCSNTQIFATVNSPCKKYLCLHCLPKDQRKAYGYINFDEINQSGYIYRFNCTNCNRTRAIPIEEPVHYCVNCFFDNVRIYVKLYDSSFDTFGNVYQNSGKYVKNPLFDMAMHQSLANFSKKRESTGIFTSTVKIETYRITEIKVGDTKISDIDFNQNIRQLVMDNSRDIGKHVVDNVLSITVFRKKVE